MKHNLLRPLIFVLVLAMILSACASPTAQVIEKTVVVEVEGQTVEKEVIKTVEVEKIVQATPVPAAGPVTLSIWATGGDFDAGLLQAVADVYSLVHPNVSFKIEGVPWSDAHTKILAAAAASTGPDIITGGMSWGIELGQNGGAIDMNKAYPEMVADIKAKTMPAIWDAITLQTGEVYAVQHYATLQVAYYRTDLLKDVGGMDNPPATWEEFTKLLDAYQAAGKDVPMLFRWGNTSWLGFQGLLYAAGGSFYSPDCKTVTVNSPEAAKALDFMMTFYSKYNTPTENWPDDMAFVTGDSPVVWDGNWGIPNYDLTKPEIKDKWTVTAMPAGPSGKSASFLGGNAISIMSYSENADTAADFISFLYTEEAVKAQANYAAAQKNIFIPPYDGYVDYMPVGQTFRDGIKALLQSAYGPPNCAGWEAGNPGIDKAIQEVVFGVSDVSTALAAMQAALEETLPK